MANIGRLIIRSLIILITVVLIQSCTDSSKSKTASSIIYTSGGRTSEVLVVISKNLWNSPLGDSIKLSLEEVPGWLAQSEPEYDISQIPYKAFGSIYQKQRNILYIKKASIKEPKVELRKNVYAKPQTVITIKANNAQSLLNSFLKYKDNIKEAFHKNEIKRIANAYRGVQVKTLSNDLDKKFGFHLVLPKGFYMAYDGADFAWLRRPTTDVEEGLFIFTKPYNDTSTFLMDSVISYRNYITKTYIPGPVDNSYMKISNVFPPMYSQTEFKGNYAVQLRSWWDVEGYPMGGPFLSYTFVDTIASRLITIDGYIKAPKKDKRDLLIHIEAIMNSFEYANPEKTIK